MRMDVGGKEVRSCNEKPDSAKTFSAVPDLAAVSPPRSLTKSCGAGNASRQESQPSFNEKLAAQ